MIGPGKYDDWCGKVRLETQAEGVILIVLDGNRGFGMSLQVTGEYLLGLPKAFRSLADQIEKDLKDLAPKDMQ